MSIEFESDRMTFGDVAKLLDMDISTVYRWWKRGVMCNGERVKLRAPRIGGRRFVYRTDLDAFLEALNQDPDNPRPAKPSAKAKRRADKAASELDRLGIGT